MSRSDAAKEWGAMFRRAREEAQLSQEELARRLGLATTTVSRWETGRSVPRNFEALDISRMLYNAIHKFGQGSPVDPPELQEVFEQIRFFWRLSGEKGEGLAWLHLRKQLDWLRHATQWGLPVERRRGTEDGRSKKDNRKSA